MMLYLMRHFMLTDKYEIGAEMYRWQVITALSTIPMKINPFDEPNVSQAKQSTLSFLERTEKLMLNSLYSSDAYDIDIISDTAEATSPLSNFIDNNSFQYVSALVYLPHTDSVVDQINQFMTKITDYCRIQQNRHVVSTVGMGPRYLHSTGQLHKGGPHQGIYIQIIDKADADNLLLSVEQKFRRLIAAQADGDFFVLHTLNRPCIRITLKDKVKQSIDTLIKDFVDQQCE